MKKYIVFLLVMVWLVACGGNSTEQQLMGKWEGVSETTEGKTMGVEFEFLEKNKVVATGAPGILNIEVIRGIL